MRIRLQIGVATAFTLLSVVMIGSTVGYLYTNNTQLALRTANAAMDDARKKTTAALLNVITPVTRAVHTTAALVTAFPDSVRGPDGMAVLNTQIEGLRQVYSVYVGLENEGEFFQVVRLPEWFEKFGPSNAPIPETSKLVLRTIDMVSGNKVDRYEYRSDWGTVTGREDAPADFDPRTRPWYMAARETDALVISPIYRFSSTGRPGVTLSKRVVSPAGQFLGVVGADMTLDTISEILDELKIGEDGYVFLLNRDRKLIVRSETVQNPNVPDSDQPIADLVIATAIAQWTREGKERFSFSVSGSDITYLASVSSFAGTFGLNLRMGFIVADREFTGAISESTRRVLVLSALIILVTIAATIFLARQLTRPLREVADEARRIRDFELDGDFSLQSRIVEVQDLTSAVASMKSSLRSFGAYVPKDLVRAIVSTGGSVHVGGVRRDVSIMFSDIEGFTGKSEELPPEAMMTDLSRYFRAMDTAIIRHHGTIDKYIGDAIMAFWNAPEEDPDHVVHACRAVLACRAAGVRLNADRRDSKLLPVHTRFGLHTDDVVIGNVGSPDRLQYTAIGAAVNLAARIEPLNKVYGTDILVTENVVGKAGNGFLFRPIDLVSPAGTTQPVMLYELVGETDNESDIAATPADRQEIDDWNECYRLYQKRAWSEAAAAFEALHAASTRKELVGRYAERCKRFAKYPPPDDWDGVKEFDAK